MTNWKDLIRKEDNPIDYHDFIPDSPEDYAEVEPKHTKAIGEILLTDGITPDSFMSWLYSLEIDKFMIQYAKMFAAKYGKDALPDDSPFLDEV